MKVLKIILMAICASLFAWVIFVIIDECNIIPITQDVNYGPVDIPVDTVKCHYVYTLEDVYGNPMVSENDSGYTISTIRTRPVDTFVVITTVNYSDNYGEITNKYASRETVCEVAKAEREQAKAALKKHKEAVKAEKLAAREKKRMVRKALKGC